MASLPIRRVLVIGSHAWSTVDAYSGLVSGFREAGYATDHYALHDRVGAAEEWIKFAQKRWGKPGDPEATPDDVLYQAGIRSVVKALEMNADAVVVTCGMLFDHRLFILFRRAGIPVFLFGTESPYDDSMLHGMAGLATAVSVNDPISVDPVQESAKRYGVDVPVCYMPLGYNPTVHSPGMADRLIIGNGGEIPAHDVVFVGNLYPSRIEWLEAMDWTGIDLGLYGVFDSLAEDSPLRQYVRGGVIRNTAATAIYQRSKIVLNLFRSEQFGPGWEVIGSRPGTSVNPRVIEAAAAGACMVSEYRPEMETVFGDALPLAHHPAQCETMIRNLLTMPERRAEISAALPAIVEPFSYTHRAREIVAILERELAKPAELEAA